MFKRKRSLHKMVDHRRPPDQIFVSLQVIEFLQPGKNDNHTFNAMQVSFFLPCMLALLGSQIDALVHRQRARLLICCVEWHPGPHRVMR